MLTRDEALRIFDGLTARGFPANLIANIESAKFVESEVVYTVRGGLKPGMSVFQRQDTVELLAIAAAENRDFSISQGLAWFA